MGSLNKLRRSGILKRLRNNRQCSVLVLYAEDRAKELAYAEDFASAQLGCWLDSLGARAVSSATPVPAPVHMAALIAA